MGSVEPRFPAAVIGLGTILGKMMEISGAAERIGLTLQRCRWLSVDVIMVLVGLICGITLFVEVGVVLLIPLAFLAAKKTHTSLLKLAIPLCTALMAVHCVVPPHPVALFVATKLGADIGTVIVYGLLVGLMASLVGGPLFLKLLATACRSKRFLPSSANLTFVKRCAAVARRHAVDHFAADRSDAGENRRRAEYGQNRHAVYAALSLSVIQYWPCLSPFGKITSSVSVRIWAWPAADPYRKGFGSIANILLIIGAGGAFNACPENQRPRLIRWRLFLPVCICT